MLTVGCSARVAATVQRRVWELSKSRLETESSRIGQNDAMRGLKKFASASRRSFPARRRRPTGQQEEALRRGAKSALMTIRGCGARGECSDQRVAREREGDGAGKTQGGTSRVTDDTRDSAPWLYPS